MSRTRTLVLTCLTSVPLALGALVALPASSYAADTDVQINEVEASGGWLDDWIELKNTGGSAVDISGWVTKDSGNSAGNTRTIPGRHHAPARGLLRRGDRRARRQR